MWERIRENLKTFGSSASQTGSTAGFLALFICLSVFGLLFYIRDSEQYQSNLPIQEVVYYSESGVRHSVQVELAETPSQWTEGLSGRTYLGPNQGMLFIFPSVNQRTFTMRNTFIPLDIIFINENLQVIKIYQNAATNQTETLYPSNGLVKYVLETNAFWTQRVGLEEGDFVEIE